MNDRQWAPRLWEGMDLFAWLRLFAQGHGQVSPKFWYIAAILGGTTALNTAFGWLQTIRYRKRIDAVKLQPPLFVLGHWRTGTTLMHELLSLDSRHASPLTFHCLEPCHAVLSETLFRKHLKFLLPGQRPMDNMAFGWEQPQEDEFALALLGQPSTYTEIAFPNRRMHGENSPLDLSSLNHRQLQDWKRVFVRFLKMVSFLDEREHGMKRRLVLKSPPHTARIPTLLELFPDAKFVYLHRDPYVTYASTLNLWQSFAVKHGMQVPRRPEVIRDKVLREYRIVIEAYRKTKHLIPAGRLVEVKYEELAANMEGETKHVYEALELGGWDVLQPRLAANIAGRKGYSTNRHTIDDDVRKVVDANWGDLL